jgi:hypothetical protein
VVLAVLVLSHGVGGVFVRLYLKLLVELKPVPPVLLEGTGIETDEGVLSVVLNGALDEGLEDAAMELLALYVFLVLENGENEIVLARLGRGVCFVDVYDEGTEIVPVPDE